MSTKKKQTRRPSLGGEGTGSDSSHEKSARPSQGYRAFLEELQQSKDGSKDAPGAHPLDGSNFEFVADVDVEDGHVFVRRRGEPARRDVGRAQDDGAAVALVASAIRGDV